MWTPRAFRPEPSRRLRLACLGLLASFGAAACGPSGGDLSTYLVLFALSDSPEDLSQLSFGVTYSGGGFVGNGTGVSCDYIADFEGVTASFSDDDDSFLDVDLDAPDEPLEAGTELVECRFEADAQPTTNDFTIEVQSAEDDFGDEVDVADVDVVVSSIDLDDSANLVAERTDAAE